LTNYSIHTVKCSGNGELKIKTKPHSIHTVKYSGNAKSEIKLKIKTKSFHP